MSALIYIFIFDDKKKRKKSTLFIVLVFNPHGTSRDGFNNNLQLFLVHRVITL